MARRVPAPAWIDAALLAAAAAALFCWSWGQWPDALVDFGREVYVPWRIIEGTRLYAELAYQNGPLSPMVNAAWFTLFGASLQTLVLWNLAIAMAIAFLLHGLLKDISDRASATIACLVFLAVFAFGQYVGIANYNYICPYSHEMTHGLLLALAALRCMSAYAGRPRRALVVGAGLFLGLLYLTKAEIFLAASLAVMLAAGLAHRVASRPPEQGMMVSLALIGSALLVVPVAAVLLLSSFLPVRDAGLAVLGSWRWVFRSDIQAIGIYRWGMGTLDTAYSLRTLLMMTAWYAALLGPAALLSWVLRNSRPWVVSLTVAAMLAGALLLGRPWAAWYEAFRPLPLILLALMIGSAARWRALRADAPAGAREIRRSAFLAFAMLLLAKIALFARVYHYGFGLAMPGVLVLVVALVGWIPAQLTRWGACGRIFRAAGLAVVLSAVLAHLQFSQGWFASKRHPVAGGADLFVSDERGRVLQEALELIRAQIKPGETLAVLPEGVMLNYLARRVNPTPYTNLIQWDMVQYGERAVVDAYRAHPPDYIALVSRDTSEHGMAIDGQPLFAWVGEHYRQVWVVGSHPLQTRGFGVLLMRRAGT